MANILINITVEEMVEEIDKVKRKWLKKEIKLVDLTNEMDGIANSFNQHPDYRYVKKYIENIILLDSNVECSTSTIANICICLVPILLTINASILSLNDNKIMGIRFGIASLIMSFGLIIIAFSILKKHLGKYAREKSFYEILLRIM